MDANTTRPETTLELQQRILARCDEWTKRQCHKAEVDLADYERKVGSDEAKFSPLWWRLRRWEIRWAYTHTLESLLHASDPVASLREHRQSWLENRAQLLERAGAPEPEQKDAQIRSEIIAGAIEQAETLIRLLTESEKGQTR